MKHIVLSLLIVFSHTGITNFNLMGEFGNFDWLGSFHVVIFYNMWFEVATAFCLVNKFTASVRQALFEQVRLPTLLFQKKLKSAP